MNNRLYIFITILILLCVNLSSALEIRNSSAVSYKYNGLDYFTDYSTVITQIPPYYGVEVVPNGTLDNPGQIKQGNRGTEVLFPYIIYNRGNQIDSYQLSFYNVVGNFIPSDIKLYLDLNHNYTLDVNETEINFIQDLKPNDYEIVILKANIPLSANVGDICYLNLTGKSLGGNLIDSDNISKIQVTEGANILTNKQVSKEKVKVGETFSYTINFGNNGIDKASNFVLIDYINFNNCALKTTYLSGSLRVVPQGSLSYFISDAKGSYWVMSEPTDASSVKGIKCEINELTPGQSGYLTFSVSVNPDAKPNDIIENFANYSYNNYTGLKTNIVRTIVIANAEVFLGPRNNPEALPGGELSPNDITIVKETAEGTRVNFVNTVKNNGGSDDIINIVIDDSSNIPSDWSVSLYQADGVTPLWDNNNDGIVDVGNVSAGNNRSFIVKVSVPFGISGNNNNKFWNILLRAESSVDTSAQPNYTIDRIENILSTTVYWAPVTQIVEPSGVVSIHDRLRYTIIFANVSDSLIEHSVLSDPLDKRLIDVGQWTDGSIKMYPYIDSLGTTPRRKMTGLNTQLPVSTTTDSIQVFLKGEYLPTEHKVVWQIYNMPPRYQGEVEFYVNISKELTKDEDIIPNIAYLISNRTPQVTASNEVQVIVGDANYTIQKEAMRKTVTVGDVVEYRITIENTSADAKIVNAKVYDKLPETFRYVKGSTKYNGIEVNDPSVNGSNIIWTIPDTLHSHKKFTIIYNAIVGINTFQGEHKNIAYADGFTAILSIYRKTETASAMVKVIERDFLPEGTIIGKVFYDDNDNKYQDEGESEGKGELGVENIRIYMEDGRYAITDKDGLYSFRGVKPGIHILKIDPITIPFGYESKRLSNKFVGDDETEFIELTPSGIAKANFRLASIEVDITPDVSAYKEYFGNEIRLSSVNKNIPVKIISVPSSLFETGKADLQVIPKELDDVVAFSKEHPDWKILVEGHTDPRPINTPEFPSNQELSEARAWAVANVLIEKGVPKSLLIVKGYGPSIPKVPNTSLENMAINRRTEVTVIPPQKIDEPFTRAQYIYRIHQVDSVMKNVTFIATIPESSQYIFEAGRWNTKPLPQPNIQDTIISWNFGDLYGGMKGILTFAIETPNERIGNIFSSKAFVQWKDANGNERKSDPLIINLAPKYSTEAKEIIFTLGDFLYDSGKANLRPVSIYYLDKLVEVFKVHYPKSNAIIDGHTDIRPINTKEFPSNKELSEARAKSVYDYLVKHGISEKRLTYNGYGPDRPIAPNDTPENMQLNRRVEVRIQLETADITAKTFGNANVVKLNIRNDNNLDTLVIKDLLPENTAYKVGSAELNGQKIDDPIIQGREITWFLRKVKVGKSVIKYSIEPIDGRSEAELDTIPEAKIKDVSKIKVKQSTLNGNGKNGKVKNGKTVSADTSKSSRLNREINYKKDVIILSPMDSTVYTLRDKITIEIQMPLTAQPRLSVNGEVISNEDKIGTKTLDIGKGCAFYTFVSVPISKGRNNVIAQGIMPDGKIVNADSIDVFYADRPAKVEVSTEPKYIPADGLTQPKVIFEVFDQNNLPVADGLFLTIYTDKGIFISKDAHPQMEGYQVRTKNGIAEVILAPANSPETRTLRVNISEKEFKTKIEFEPELRDFIVVGFTEGTIGYNTFRGNIQNISQDEIDDLDFNKEISTDGRARLFLKGRIPGDFLLTALYDSDKRWYGSQKDADRAKLYDKEVNPNEYYPVYGDESNVYYEVQTQVPLFIKVEKKKSYILYGDYNTDLTSNELAGYSRTFNGAKANIETEYFTLRTFGNYSHQSIQLDEIPGKGISGYYFLSNTNVIENSEKITIEIRDRFHPENIISQVQLQRYKDYEIYYEDGAIMFTEPIQSMDRFLNPIWIVVRYESNSKSDNFYNYGGRMAVRYEDNAELGITRVEEQNAVDNYALNGVDGKVNLFDKKLSIKGEYANSKGYQRSLADAYTISLDAKDKRGSFSTYYRNIDRNFYNTSSTRAEVGTEKYGMRWKVNKLVIDKLDFSGDVYRQIDNKGVRPYRLDVARTLFGYSVGSFKYSFGYQFNRSVKDTTDKSSQMILADVKFNPSSKSFMKYITFNLGYEQIIVGSTVGDYPSKVKAGIDYTRKFESGVVNEFKIFNNTEYQFNYADTTNDDRFISTFGFETNVLQYTKLYTHTTLRKEGEQVKEGISQTINLPKHWQLILSAEAVQNIGNNIDEHIAFSSQFQKSDSLSQLSAKYEIRLSDKDNTHILDVQHKRKFGKKFSLLARETFWLNDVKLGEDRVRSDGQVGLAYRPVFNDKLNLISMGRLKYERVGDKRDSRAILSAEAIYQPNRKTQLKGRYAIKRTDWASEYTNGNITTYTDLTILEFLYEFTDLLDMGIGGRLLHQYQTKTYRYSSGPYLGIKVIKDLYGVVGYNVVGFEDSDFSDYSYWKQGPFISIRFKFDEDLFK